MSPRSSFIVTKLDGAAVLGSVGTALDLGAGPGDAAAALAERGYTVHAVEKYRTVIDHTQTDSDAISFIHEDIRDYPIEPDTYDIVIAHNILPFMPDKETVARIISNAVTGLRDQGVLFISLFGPNDAWADKEDMTFYSYDDALGVLGKHDLTFVHKATEEGWGRMMNQELKYWHIHRFICRKTS